MLWMCICFTQQYSCLHLKNQSLEYLHSGEDNILRAEANLKLVWVTGLLLASKYPVSVPRVHQD